MSEFGNKMTELAEAIKTKNSTVHGQLTLQGMINAVNDISTVPEGAYGMPIGAIFSFPSSMPPEGAYLLNGQTIYDCANLYPSFWRWLTDNSGDMVTNHIYKPWVMPALTENGTVGGSSYAVTTSTSTNSSRPAYKSFDGTLGGSNTYCSINGVNAGWITYYSPELIKLTRVQFQNPTAGTVGYRPSSIVLSGSVDNYVWDEIAYITYESTANSAIQIIDIPDTTYTDNNIGYKYFKFDVVNSSGSTTEVAIPEITLYGQEYSYTDYTDSGNILTLSAEAYEYTMERTGVCGGFVLDSISGNVRLPKVIDGTLWGADSTNIGQSLAAGLPNIEGEYSIRAADKMGAMSNEGVATGAFSIGDEAAGSTHPASTTGNASYTLKFSAENSNPIYGNSDTVQPPAIRVSWCIQVFNAATALSEQESAQLASQMQTKAQTDFGNVAENLDFVVETWRSDDGTSWYRKYRSGWVEQFGLIGDVATGWITITLPVEMADANYFIGKMTVATSSDYGSIRGHSVSNLTTTTFEFYNSSLYSNGGWYVSGKAANTTEE